jgi:hypothetical protein
MTLLLDQSELADATIGMRRSGNGGCSGPS